MDLGNIIPPVTKDEGLRGEQHEHADRFPDDEGFVRRVEGEVGDVDEEDGGEDGGDQVRLHPSRQVDVESQVGVLHRVLARLELFNLLVIIDGT